MAEAYLRTDAVRLFSFTDLAAPVTGGTVTYTLTSPTGTTLLSAVAATESGNGFYFYTVDGPTSLTVPGFYRERWVASKSGVDKTFDQHLLVLEPQGPRWRRWELRHSLAQMLGDLRIGVSTGSNGTGTLKDTGLVEGDNDWRGAWLYLYAGTSRGDERAVTQFTQSTGALLVSPVFTTTPDTTTRYELHRRWSVDQYNRALDMAVQEAAHDYLLPATDESLTITDTSVYEYTIPYGFYALSEVWWEDTTATGPVWEALQRRTHEWQVLPARNLLRLASPPSATARLRLVGQACPTAFVSDDDHVVVPADYLRYKAAALLLAGKVHGPQNDPDATLQLYDRYQQAAEGLLNRHRRPLALNAVRV